MKLTLNEQKRLREIVRDRNGSYPGLMKATTKKLREKGLIEVRGEKIASTGRLMQAGTAFPTDAGRQWVAENS